MEHDKNVLVSETHQKVPQGQHFVMRDLRRESQEPDAAETPRPAVPRRQPGQRGGAVGIRGRVYFWAPGSGPKL